MDTWTVPSCPCSPVVEFNQAAMTMNGMGEKAR